MRAIYLFPALLGACFALFGSSGSLQAQDGATPPDSASAPIDPSDGQPPQGPNNPPQPPANPDICGIKKDSISCKWPYNFGPDVDPSNVLPNIKCDLRGQCKPDPKNAGVYLCEKGPGNLPFEEYEGTRTVIKDIKQIESAPNAKDKKMYSVDKKTCFTIWQCEPKCQELGSWLCKRDENTKKLETYEVFQFKGNCPVLPPNPNPNPNPNPPKPEVGPDLN